MLFDHHSASGAKHGVGGGSVMGKLGSPDPTNMPYMNEELWSAVRRRPWELRGDDHHQYSSERGGGGVTSSDEHSPSSPSWSRPRLSGSCVGGPRALNAMGGGLPMTHFTCDFSRQVEIGRGDFGDVTAATYDLDGQRYAIKTMRKEIRGEVDLQRRLQEVFALSSCTSSHLLRYHDSWIEGGIVYLRTELLTGGNVLSRQEKWEEFELWDLIRQVALGIQAMHVANIAHLDVKPDNIFFQPSTAEPLGVVYKIGDFGLARPVDGGVLAGEHFFGINDDEGDCRYLCPALLAQGVRAGMLREADMFALGSSILHIACGDPRALNKNPKSLEKYSLEFQELVRQLISPDPAHRPSADQVVEACYRQLESRFPAPHDVRLEERRLDDDIAALEAELAQIEADGTHVYC